MISRKLVAIGFAFQLMAVPAMAQTAADSNKNAHHYSGGPKTEVPHAMKHPKTTGKAKAKAKATTSTGHHYGGGPKTESHHMGEKK